jgi:opacity protein-like surface antigen
MKKLFVLFFFGAFALPAAAQDLGQFYIGGGLGRAAYDNVCGGATFECKDRDTAWNAFAGWQLLRYLAIEAGVGEMGHVTIDASNAKANAIELDAVGTLPLLGGFSLIGRIGAFHGDMHGEGISQRKNAATAGLGAQLEPDRNYALRVEWQRYPDMGGGPFIATTNVDVTRVSMLIRFR